MGDFRLPPDVAAMIVALQRQADSLAARLHALQGQQSSGVVTLTWSGAASAVSQFSASIPHGLGGVPEIWLTPRSQANTGPTFAWREAVDATSFTCRASTPSFTPPSGTTQTYAWLARLP